jgi:acyl phosphate:glycerol-3-phosphate acyltransferase
MWLNLILIVGAYLLGSISSAVLVCRALNLPDPREQGSGNPGATNVLRFGGKQAAAVTLLGDLFKGLLPVLLGRALGMDAPILAAIALAAFLGHLYPVFFGFRGGKGVATAFGALLGLSPWAALAALATWLVVAFGLKISSLAALSACVLAPLYLWLLGAPPSWVLALAAMALLLIWRHRGNIQRLLAGREGRIGER